jgi:undecaprenyl-diphosphatase
LERHELLWLLGGLVIGVLFYAFAALAGEVMESNTAAFDTKILRALRTADDASTPIGPHCLEVALLDVTTLGGAPINRLGEPEVRRSA